MEAKHFIRLRQILKRWFDLQRRIQNHEEEYLYDQSKQSEWRKYHALYWRCGEHIRRMYCMYADVLYGESHINENCKFIMSHGK